jgi:hypothetical protein
MFQLRLLLLTVASLIALSASANTAHEWIKLGMAQSVAPNGAPYPVFYSPAIERKGDLAIAHVFSKNEGSQGSEVDVFMIDCRKNVWSWVKQISYSDREAKGKVLSVDDSAGRLKHYQNKPIPTHDLKPAEDGGYGIMTLSLFKKLKFIACGEPASTPQIKAAEMGKYAGLIQRALRGMRGDDQNMDKLVRAVESLKNKYGMNAEFQHAYKSTYESTMKSLDDHTAAQEALKIYQTEYLSGR